jgi:hypothetical protein
LKNDPAIVVVEARAPHGIRNRRVNANKKERISIEGEKFCISSVFSNRCIVTFLYSFSSLLQGVFLFFFFLQTSFSYALGKYREMKVSIETTQENECR